MIWVSASHLGHDILVSQMVKQHISWLPVYCHATCACTSSVVATWTRSMYGSVRLHMLQPDEQADFNRVESVDVITN